jgi:hypothetical protein
MIFPLIGSGRANRTRAGTVALWGVPLPQVAVLLAVGAVGATGANLARRVGAFVSQNPSSSS